MAFATFNSVVLKALAHLEIPIISARTRRHRQGRGSLMAPLLSFGQTTSDHVVKSHRHVNQEKRLLRIFIGLIICSILITRICVASENAAGDAIALAQKTYQEAKKEYDNHPDEPQAAWQYARTTFDYSDIVPGNGQRAQIAEEGIAACKRGLEKAPESAPLHYYLGLNQGELARTKTLGALRLVDQMEREFARAIQLDPNFDYAGAERSLGLLYRDAPVFASIGSKTKARLHLQRALELAPRYPENRLNLVESELKWGDRKAARHDLQLLEDNWAAAHTEFAGASWALSWSDWEARLDKVRKVLEDPPRLESPRH
jgi:tetratricopeptide (TPR) repeat protein